MCRLFAMSGGPQRVSATFWLLEAPDSLTVQSHKDPDGTGLGFFGADGSPVLHRWPLAAYEDREFIDDAKQVESRTFIAHVRHATNGSVDDKNTHPFEQRGRMFAHNGLLEGIEEMDAELGPHAALVAGETDSERLFALITRQIDAHSGDVTQGIVSAMRWIAAEVPLFAANFVLTTDRELWALRYPEIHRLFVLERPAGGHMGDQHLHHVSAARTVRVRSDHLTEHAAVVVASEPLDDDPGWRGLEPGELLHVDPELRVSTEIVLPDPPAHQLRLEDLDPAIVHTQRTQFA